MADVKISALPVATTPLAGTEVLPIVQSGVTKQVLNNDLRPKQIQANATSGVLQVTGPSASTTRVMTTPDANFTVARTDASQTFTSAQTFSNTLGTQYALTSFSGTTAIVDTGIVVAMDTVSTSQMYQVDIKVNLSPGGPGNRRTVASYLVAVSAGTSVNISEILQHRISQAGIGNVTLTSHFWDGTTEATSFSSGGPWQIRLKMTGFFADPSASMQCRITQITP
jgi:hypothetical protein